MKSMTPAEEAAAIRAIQLYGANGWRAQNSHLYKTDAALRWLVDRYRDDLLSRGALAIFGGRLFGMEPTFTDCMREYGIQAANERQRGFDTREAETSTSRCL